MKKRTKTDLNIINEDINYLKDKLKSIERQKRRDHGIKRGKYNSNLPKHYKSFLLRANKKGLTFELTVEDFERITANNCIYCGNSNKIGIDRINPKDGYTLENSQPCCGTCNLMKYTHSHDFFINHIKRIIKHVNFDN